MNKETAEKELSAYIRPVFGFALKRCKSIQDAEDLSQEIILRAYRAMSIRDDIDDVGKFIWTIAHNMLANYYRDISREAVGIPLDDIAETLAAVDDTTEETDCENIAGLLKEIAYLSKLQRRIVIAYYFENKKQTEIADELGIPLGTVKWHLFEAKKELKRGINTVRKTSELKFNPIKFDSYGINGSIGTKSPDEFFRSVLVQNICYCVRDTYKTVNEIADDLGVSPVFIESETEHLDEYGYLKSAKNKYICNFIIDEPTSELLTMQDQMYKQAAAIFANELFDELTKSGILDDPDIYCGYTDQPITMTDTTESPRDHNFLLWALIPYLAACSGDELLDERITFREVSTVRPDGANNIFSASVRGSHLQLPPDYVEMKNWCGPMWNEKNDLRIWQVNSEWCSRGTPDMQNVSDVRRILSLFADEGNEDDWLWLAERGYVKTCGSPDGHFKAHWQIVWLQNKEIHNKLIDIGYRIKKKYEDEFNHIKAPYVKASLDAVPDHLKKIREYELQYVFHSAGWFLLHCIRALLDNGKLKPPTENQKKCLSTIIMEKPH
ncbi:MAG: RNA polymerase sigma factor [Clostridia bacterium]|nr:RNA polymerase sigma factor [Clostridia bacterium]